MGGVAGHMAHLSEDLDLTFDDIASILQKVASADIQNATEKVDGQNLFLTVTDGEIRTARNNGDVKKGGMTTDEYISKWRGHPAENAFTNGFKAISAALRKLSPEVLGGIFSLAKEMFPKLSIAVDSSIQDIANELWTINGPKAVALNKLADGLALEEVTSKIQSFAAVVGMDATLGDYVSLVVRKYAEQVGLPENILEPLLALMLDPDEAKSRGIKVVPLKKVYLKNYNQLFQN